MNAQSTCFPGSGQEPLFRSFFLGGFECSTHRLRNGRRLDLVAATRHQEFAEADYRRLAGVGIRAAREGIRWHLIEKTPGAYDFSTVLPIIRAAQAHQAQVIWDLLHFGWPDHIDIFRPYFVERFAALAGAFAKLLHDETGGPLYFTPVNEISFLSWVGAEVGAINPFAEERGFELKCQLVRAAIAAIEAVWDVDPLARIYHAEPMFNVIAHSDRPEDALAAEEYRQLQFQVYDMLAGEVWPQLGGDPKYLDVLGANYYPWNQWTYNGPIHAGDTIPETDPAYRPLADMLDELYQRYRCPLFLAETGRENEKRPAWLRYVGEQVRIAMARGIPLLGVCLYPIVNFPGWENDRHCHNGLWDYADDRGHREIYAPLAEELHRQRRAMDEGGDAAVNGPADPAKAAAAEAALASAAADREPLGAGSAPGPAQRRRAAVDQGLRTGARS